MSRLRIALPIFLSSITIPTLAHSAAYCTYANWHTPQCESQRTFAFERARNVEIEASIARVKHERARAFAVARNLEINASVARVETERSRQLALSLTHCKTADSTTPRCLAEREREIALNRTHCKSVSSTTPRCEAERAREFAAARNVEINASIARVVAERKRAFTAARNAEINISMARVEAERSRQIALSLTHCKTADSTTPRCLAERGRQFAAARNAEAEASIARVAEARNFTRDRNAEIVASMARVEAERSRQLAMSLTHCKTVDSTAPRCLAEREFAAARNAEVEASIAMVQAVRAIAKARDAQIMRSLAAAKAERERKFEMTRNAEITASIARVEAARDRGEVVAAYDMPPLETGAINFEDMPTHVAPAPILHNSATKTKPCREARFLTSPLHFSNASTQIDDDMKLELERLASIAEACPSIRIEVHGHSDAGGPAQVNRSIADRRAEAAVNYLVSAGVERKRLTAIGHGAMDPIMPNTSEANRAVNRRVEISIHDPAMNAVAQKIMWDLAELLDPTYVPKVARLTP